MKKGSLILLVAAMALTVSVAANTKAMRTEVCIVDDVGDTKVVKAMKTVNTMVLKSGIALVIVPVDAAEILVDYETLHDVTPESVIYREVKLEKTTKLYLLNCSIRQCSGHTVAAV